MNGEKRRHNVTSIQSRRRLALLLRALRLLMINASTTRKQRIIAVNRGEKGSEAERLLKLDMDEDTYKRM
jgi:hypothetical protein